MDRLIVEQIAWANREAHRRRPAPDPSPWQAFLALSWPERAAVVAGGVVGTFLAWALVWALWIVLVGLTGGAA